MSYYLVLLAVPINDMKEWGKVNEIADRIDSRSTGAGTGFGSRDIDWERESRDEAVGLKMALLTEFRKEGFKPKVQIIKR